MDRLLKDITILDWAKERGILTETIESRALKISEESGEFSRYTVRQDKEMRLDTIGDLYIALVITAAVEGVTLDHCIDAALNEIKDRAGERVGGVFVKQDDLKKE